MSTETQLIQSWIKDNGNAKRIILRKVNTIILNIIPDDVSLLACDAWTILADQFDCIDISVQYTIKNQLNDLRMKNAGDTQCYVSVHISANEHLSYMGAPLNNLEAIYLLLCGLPATGLWTCVHKIIDIQPIHFEQLIQQ
ncbi:hypothetical protein SERLADRAFT_434247 [Serpula lacrymans var. lacrymans S7.9]|uniref:Uncharacterized protein n=1 Tax=Serpula lacrymans var. lacrymans (strain S7.9) TaxID=578457 RepID=F8NK76_SERL9|nr:uncharacterized protein SERLADRAFT_434247 [Serpula lacrymans var. lacrymans S7.9]EGO28342.1 hypothetical protein SERLADRAFT_434247 [Serpula lacrymans var. lacrymans S7.9]